MRAIALCAHILLLAAACDRNIYVGHDEPRELAGAPGVVVPATPELEAVSDAGVAMGAGAAPPAAAAPMVMLATPPKVATPAAPQCVAPQADCDGIADNGCETDLVNDRQHCGGCDTACKAADCVCENGKLALRCPTYHADCDADMNNGCETDLQTSTEHCGMCKHVCHTNGHDVVTAACVSGQCEMTCEPRVSPETDCDHNPDNGCETYLWFDANNCGQCGNRCATMCEAGVCML